MSVVIYSEENGVFLGHAMGLAFWSALDPAGQESAPTFDTPEHAYKFIGSWLPGACPADVKAVDVVPDTEGPDGNITYASANACIAAGLPGWLTELTADMHARHYGERPSMH